MLLNHMIKLALKNSEGDVEDHFNGDLPNLHMGRNKKLYGLLENYLADEEILIETEVPDGFFRILPEYKHDDIENVVLDGLQSGGSTVKTISGSVDRFDDIRISVAVTFQACLHLDVSGKVVLFQGVDDVLVRPKG